MRDLTLAIPQSVGKTKNQILSTRLHFNYILLGLIIVLGLTYLFAVNSLSTKGLAIKQLQIQLDELQTEQKSLQLQSSDLQSINLLQQNATAEGFVPTTGVTYLTNSNFALK